MRQQFIQADTIDDAYDIAPWAGEIVEVDGGFMAFEGEDDYMIWQNQK